MFCYLLIINFLTFLSYAIDKYNAIKRKKRLPESYLFFLAILGGSIGALLGMKVFHHKVRKIYFYILNLIFLSCWIYCLIGYY